MLVSLKTVCISSLIGRLFLDEPSSCLLADTCNVANLVLEGNTVKLVCTLKQLRAKCGGDELCIIRESLDHGCSQEGGEGGRGGGRK